MAAELLYYLRDSNVPLYVWAPGKTPHNHYEMTRPFRADAPEPVLFVSLRPCPKPITKAFGEVTVFPPVRVSLVKDEARTLYIYVD